MGEINLQEQRETGLVPSAAEGQSIPLGILCHAFLPHPTVHNKGHFQDARPAREQFWPG